MLVKLRYEFLLHFVPTQKDTCIKYFTLWTWNLLYELQSNQRLHCLLSHGGLYRWRENSLPFFLNQKLKEISTRYKRTILTASKVRKISKI